MHIKYDFTYKHNVNFWNGAKICKITVTAIYNSYFEQVVLRYGSFKGGNPEHLTSPTKKHTIEFSLDVPNNRAVHQELKTFRKIKSEICLF